MKVPFTKNIRNLYQGLSNPGFRSVKVQTETFLKKDLWDFKNSFCLGIDHIHNSKKTVCCPNEVIPDFLNRL